MDKNTTLPIQRCLAGYDVSVLSDTELIAILLGAGTARQGVLAIAGRLLARFGDLKGINNAGVREIMTIDGMGGHKAVRLKAAGEIGRRVITRAAPVRHIDNPEMVWILVRPDIIGLRKETFYSVILNNKNMVLKKSLVSLGTVSEALVHPREVFQDAIRECASSIILVHNHPSGDVTPSREDIETTHRLVSAGEILGIRVIDHVIVSDHAYVSFKEQGLLT